MISVKMADLRDEKVLKKINVGKKRQSNQRKN